MQITSTATRPMARRRAAVQAQKAPAQSADTFEPTATPRERVQAKADKGHKIAMTLCGAAVGVGVGMLAVGFGAGLLIGAAAGGAVALAGGLLAFRGGSKNEAKTSTQKDSKPSPAPATPKQTPSAAKKPAAASLKRAISASVAAGTVALTGGISGAMGGAMAGFAGAAVAGSTLGASGLLGGEFLNAAGNDSSRQAYSSQISPNGLYGQNSYSNVGLFTSSDNGSEEAVQEKNVVDISAELSSEDVKVIEMGCSGCGAPIVGSGSCGHCGSENIVVANGQIIR